MLTLLIAEYVLQEYHPAVMIKNADKPLKGVRLSTPLEDDEFLHIFSENDSVVCQNGADYIMVKDSDILIIIDKIQAFLEKLTGWKEDLFNLISKGASLKELVDRSVTVMENPIFIIDESNIVRAISNHGIGEINADWDYILENGCVKLDIVQNTFSTPPFKRQVKAVPIKPFYLKPKGAINGAINFRIPSGKGKMHVGSLIVFEGLTPISSAMLQYVTILSDAILLWFKFHSGEQAMNSAREVLEELINDGSLLDSGENMLKSTIEPSDGHYALICATGQRDANLEPYLLNLAELLPYSISCVLNEKIVVLTDAQNCYRHAEKLEMLIHSENPSIGVSGAFSELRQASALLTQALIAMEYGQGGIARLNAEIMMNYIAHEANKMIKNISIIHPALGVLKSYDAKHNGDYYKTLYVFLMAERSITASLPILCIHRNTMIFRLERLKSMTEADLDNAAVREWILFSYRVCGVPIF